MFLPANCFNEQLKHLRLTRLRLASTRKLGKFIYGTKKKNTVKRALSGPHKTRTSIFLFPHSLNTCIQRAPPLLLLETCNKRTLQKECMIFLSTFKQIVYLGLLTNCAVKEMQCFVIRFCFHRTFVDSMRCRYCYCILKSLYLLYIYLPLGSLTKPQRQRQGERP